MQVCGDAEVWGDGIVPVPTAHLDGAINIDLEGVYHSPLGSSKVLVLLRDSLGLVLACRSDSSSGASMLSNAIEWMTSSDACMFENLCKTQQPLLTQRSGCSLGNGMATKGHWMSG